MILDPEKTFRNPGSSVQTGTGSWIRNTRNACLDSSRHRRRPDRHRTAAEDRMGSGPCPARRAALCTRQHYSRAQSTELITGPPELVQHFRL
jgi:hypothetical protein